MNPSILCDQGTGDWRKARQEAFFWGKVTFEVKSEGTGKLDIGEETEYEIIDSIGAVDDILNDSVEEKQS